MKIWEKVKAVYAKVDSVVECAVLYVGSTILDTLSSLHMPAGFEETNHFAKHADGSFWLQHATITDSINTFETLIASAGLYIGARMLGSKYAKLAAGVPWLYFAWLHLDAAFTNFLYEIPNLYQATAQDMLRSMLGH